MASLNVVLRLPFLESERKNPSAPLPFPALLSAQQPFPASLGAPFASETLIPFQALAEMIELVQKLLGAWIAAENKGKCFGSHFQPSKDLK